MRNLGSHSCVKWHVVARSFAVVDYAREMTAEGPLKFGKYRLFEYLLFLLYISLCICNLFD